MCERSENEVVPISRLFNCSAEFELPKIWIRKRTFAMWLRFRIASHKITPVYRRSFNNTAALNGRQLHNHLITHINNLLINTSYTKCKNKNLV